jgi:mono/diheme cytochrome c family protein
MRQTTILLMPLLALGGCTSIEVLAPPVDQLYIREAKISTDRAAYLDSGRKIYLNSCSRCHSVQQVDEITADGWKEMPKMHEKAKLYDDEIARLEAYLKTSAPINQRLIKLRDQK